MNGHNKKNNADDDRFIPSLLISLFITFNVFNMMRKLIDLILSSIQLKMSEVSQKLNEKIVNCVKQKKGARKVQHSRTRPKHRLRNSSVSYRELLVFILAMHINFWHCRLSSFYNVYVYKDFLLTKQKSSPRNKKELV